MPSLVGYPQTLPQITKSKNFIFNSIPFNANFDIIWSFEFNLSGSTGLEGGFVTFLTSIPQLTGGNVGVDLSYSGITSGGMRYTDLNSYSTGNTLTATTHQGILSAILGVGFDTSGLFGLSCSYDGVKTRDGVGLANIKPNSLIVRGGFPSYPLLYNQQLSSLSSDFQIFNNTSQFTKIRCRLGDVGRKLFVDYKRVTDLNYINLVSIPVNLIINDNTRYYVGMSFASPISSNDATKVCNLQIKNFHVEGRYDDSVSYTIIDSKLVSSIVSNLVTEVNTLSTAIPYTTGIQNVNLELYTIATSGMEDSQVFINV